MAAEKLTRDLLPLLRQCRQLDRKRTRAGLSPEEHERWLVLKTRLGANLSPSERERRRFERVATRLRTSFRTPRALHEAIISNLSSGGVFVATAHPAEIGTKLRLNLRIESTGERIELACVVVSQNVASDFSTQTLGMGLCFTDLDGQQREAVARLYEEAKQG